MSSLVSSEIASVKQNQAGTGRPALTVTVWTVPSVVSTPQSRRELQSVAVADAQKPLQ